MGAHPPSPPSLRRRGRTHPGAQRVAEGLLDAADKVPSFGPEQEFTPEESELRSPTGRGEGPAGGELPSLLDSSWKAPGPWSSPLPCPPAPLPHGKGPKRLFGKQPLWSIKEQPAKVPSPGRGGTQPQDVAPEDAETQSHLPGPYLGNHLACSVQGSSPRSQVCKPPEQKKHLTLSCRPAVGGGTEILASPHGALPPGPGVSSRLRAGATMSSFLMGRGLSEVLHEPWGLPLASATPAPHVLPRFHRQPVSQR